jgi:hypothetical protein
MVSAVPSKNLKVFGFVVGTAVIVAIVIAVLGIIAAEPRDHTPDPEDLVHIQVRSSPAHVELMMNGHREGPTPVMLHIPKSDTAIELAVTLHGHVITQRVVPDRDRVVDLASPGR